MEPGFRHAWWLFPAAVGAVGLGLCALWLLRGPDVTLTLRRPGTDQPPGTEAGPSANAVLAGKLIPGQAAPTNLPGVWLQFRGPERDGISRETVPLARTWPEAGPKSLWSVEVGEGYAGPAVLDGRVYLMDYDRDKRQDALRCLSLEDGKEIWRYAYSVSIKRNHGMSRTVPVVTTNLVVALGPKCHVLCCDAVSGELRWGLDLVRQFGTIVPPWYAGQCPLMDSNRVILAPGGRNALLLAVEADTGKVVWQTPNPRGWKMTHSSVMPMDFAGRRMFIYCADKGVVGVSADTGEILWDTTEWKISIATVPSPLVVGDGRIFLTGGYNAGSLMLRLKEAGDRVTPETEFRLDAQTFGATQQTPILWQNHIYGVRADGKFICLTLDGKPVWNSTGPQFGLGPFLLAGDSFYALNDSGLLRLIEATPAKYNSPAKAQVLTGRECWGPMAFVGGRLLVRDLTRLSCLDVSAP